MITPHDFQHPFYCTTLYNIKIEAGEIQGYWLFDFDMNNCYSS